MTLLKKPKKKSRERQLTFQYILAVSIVFILSLSTLLTLQYVVSNQDSYATVINISGRQRMLSQRTIMLLFHLYDISDSETEHIRVTEEKLLESINLMAKSHEILSSGELEDGSHFKLSPTISSMYFDGPMHLDALVTEHVKAINELLHTNEPDYKKADKILHIVENTLLSSLNAVVHQYEIESNSYMLLLKRIQLFVFLVTCLVLISIVYFIFRPMVRSVVENENMLNSMLDDLPVYMDIVSKDLTILYQSKYLSDAIGANGTGKKCFDIYKDNRRQCRNCPLSETRREDAGNIITVDNCLGGKTLQVAHVQISFQGEPAILETFTDITEQQRTEQILIEAKETAEKANKMKSEFLASMSHEIRTPINAIVGLVYLTLETELSVKQKDYLKKISSSANQLIGLIDNLLDYSKIETKSISLKSVPFNLNDTMDNLASLVTYEALEQRLEVNFNIEPNVPTALIGDQQRLEQILNQLIQNSLKFTEAGYVDINTECVHSDEGNARLRFSVDDSGIGIQKNLAEYIFQPFSQGEDSNIRQHGGTGMGLAMCKDLVELMGGTIQLESKESPGSLFSFILDFPLADDQQQQFPHELQGSKLLIVDDHPMARKSLEYMLSGMGLEIVSVSSAEEAYDFLKEAKKAAAPFDFITLDFQMQGINGIEAAQAIRRDSNTYGNPNIFLLTAYSKSQVVQRAEDIFDGLLLKPINRAVLMGSLLAAHKGEIAAPLQIDDTQEQYLPETLPGINMTRGLAQAGANRKIYSSVLQKFLKNYTSYIEQIRFAHENGDSSTAHRLIHTLKGVAGNIGAMELQQAALMLENSKHENRDFAEQLNIMENSLQEVFSSIESLKSEKTPVTNEESKDNSSIDTAAVQSLTDKIIVLLEESDTEAEQHIERLSTLLKNTSLQQYCMQLEEKIGRYEFEEALEIVKQILTELPG